MQLRNAASHRLQAAAALCGLLVASASIPALASSGIVICDETDRNSNRGVAAVELNVRIVDHRPVGKPAGEVLTSRIAPSEEAASSPNADAAEDVSAELEEIATDAAGDEPAASPIVEVSAPDVADTNGDQRAPSDADPGIATRLPGIVDGDLVRFRNQMYRTDI